MQHLVPRVQCGAIRVRLPGVGPADPQDIMAALLRTPPPPAGDKSTRKKKQPRKRGR
jgi:hypothetical protein